jgi:hypothetical protein
MGQQTGVDPKMVAAAERQMRNWVLGEQVANRKTEDSLPGRGAQQAVRYISISREAGARGGEIAQLVGKELGWEVLDKTLLDVIADRYQLCRAMLELVDETKVNWAHDVLGTFLDSHIIPHEKYLVHLARIVRLAGRQGNVVIVGRGAHFLLPRAQGLAVRVVASEKYRAQQLMERLGCDAAKARRMMIEIDRGRAEFVQRFFHHNIGDPCLYDLVVNVEQLGVTAATALIVKARQELAARLPGHPAKATAGPALSAGAPSG